MILELSAIFFMLMCVFLIALLSGDIISLIMFGAMSVVATVLQMAWVEVNGGQVLATHLTNYVMWGCTTSFAVILIRRLKGTQ